MSELLSCPFCGGEAKVYDHKLVDPSHICVYCLDCGAQTKKFYPWFEGGVEHREECIRAAIEAWNTRHIDGETSDGYHTFNELYHHRALLFSVVVRNHPERCWKSKKHHTGDMYEGMFIVGIDTPDGQASYHYDIDPYWDMFDCEELEFAPEWDGHTPAQAIERIGKLRPTVIANITFTAKQQEEIFERVMETCREEGLIEVPQTCETCPQIDNRDSFIFHLLQAERHERTCRNTAVTPLAFKCGKCGWFDKNRCDFNFCPNCGCRVKED